MSNNCAEHINKNCGKCKEVIRSRNKGWRNFYLIKALYEQALNEKIEYQERLEQLSNDVGIPKHVAGKISDFVLQLSMSCDICTENFDTNEHKVVVSLCGHYFCQSCTKQMNRCPTCRKNMEKIEMK